MPAHYSDGSVMTEADNEKRIFAQIAINTGDDTYEDGTPILYTDDLKKILVQIALNTE